MTQPLPGPRLDGLLFAEGEVTCGGSRGFAWNRAKEQQSGDWWAVRSAGDGVVLVIADTVGHGQTASGLAATAFGSFQMACLGMRDDLQPASLLDLMNRVWVDMLGEVSVMSVLAMRIDSTRVTYASAGHPAPILVGANGAETLATDGAPPLGARGATRYPQHELVVAAGDVLVAYTDGVTEQRGPDGVRFGSRRLLEGCAQAGRSPEALVAHVRTALHAHEAGEPSADDASVVTWAVGP
ncbi:MAG: PP2C family protein-serine/threonine phosphatase [Myxococcota bacterium]